jgi:hypothetical protein
MCKTRGNTRGSMKKFALFAKWEHFRQNRKSKVIFLKIRLKKENCKDFCEHFREIEISQNFVKIC